MPELIDPLGNRCVLPMPAHRIVSLVPSQTELLADLGLDAEVVGITKFCVHPPSWRREKKIIGGTKNLRLDAIRQLQPDLVLANREENERDQVKVLQAEFPVYCSNVSDLEDNYRLIADLGALTGREKTSDQLIKETRSAFAALSERVLSSGATVLYLIWREPWLSVGGDTYINDMLVRCGWVNILGSNRRYPEVREGLDPDLVFLSSEPFPFLEKHVKEVQLRYPRARVMLVEGEYFSWYGSRPLLPAPYFLQLLEKISTSG